jgi:hypothetical protein
MAAKERKTRKERCANCCGTCRKIGARGRRGVAPDIEAAARGPDVEGAAMGLRIGATMPARCETKWIIVRRVTPRGLHSM